MCNTSRLLITTSGDNMKAGHQRQSSGGGSSLSVGGSYETRNYRPLASNEFTMRSSSQKWPPFSELIPANESSKPKMATRGRRGKLESDFSETSTRARENKVTLKLGHREEFTSRILTREVAKLNFMQVHGDQTDNQKLVNRIGVPNVCDGWSKGEPNEMDTKTSLEFAHFEGESSDLVSDDFVKNPEFRCQHKSKTKSTTSIKVKSNSQINKNKKKPKAVAYGGENKILSLTSREWPMISKFSRITSNSEQILKGNFSCFVKNTNDFNLAKYILIYALTTSLVAINCQAQSVISSDYWAHRRQQQPQQHELQHQLQVQDAKLGPTAPISALVPINMADIAPFVRNSSPQTSHNSAVQNLAPALINGRSDAQDTSNPLNQKRQLMIGQHYTNFSSIIPYSIEQDSDYPAEDPLVGADDEDQRLSGFRSQQMSQYQDATIEANKDEPQAQTHKLTQRPDKPKSRALLPLDSSRLMLPQMQQIKSRFNQGCVGGTKCQFFAFCWMSGGSLGASCGLLMTCCVTPSRQEIQPGFYGPVVNDPYCGRSTSKINRIVGGMDASFGQFPWQAFVQVGGSRCGGALISSRHVVTAGHCVARSQHSPSSIKVTLGDYILNSDIESIPHEVFSVVEVLLHPNFRFTPQADRYDVAVLELDRTASYKDNIKPICLPQKDASFVGRVAYVAGWGALQAGSKLRPKVLQHVAVPVIENPVCEGWHRRKGIDIRIYDEMMCAGYELGQRDACQGDSGGPLMLNQFGVWYLVGIVSAGYSCAKQYQPGIYHRVSSSSDWISSNVYQQQGANN